MYRKITVDGTEMELSANAATPFRFKQVFHKDLLATFANETRAQEEGIETISQLAYIMNKQAQKADMNKLTEEDFISWLEGFEAMAFVEASEEILGVYMGSAETTSKP